MDNRTKWILGSVGALGCLGVIGAVILVIFASVMLMQSAFLETAEEVESHTPDTGQIAHCREAMEIRAGAEIEVEWYYFQPGFQDDRLQCHFTATAASPDEIFNEIVDPATDEDQNIYPGRYLKITIEDNGDGTYFIQAFYYEI